MDDKKNNLLNSVNDDIIDNSSIKTGNNNYMNDRSSFFLLNNNDNKNIYDANNSSIVNDTNNINRELTNKQEQIISESMFISEKTENKIKKTYSIKKYIFFIIILFIIILVVIFLNKKLFIEKKELLICSKKKKQENIEYRITFKNEYFAEGNIIISTDVSQLTEEEYNMTKNLNLCTGVTLDIDSGVIITSCKQTENNKIISVDMKIKPDNNNEMKDSLIAKKSLEKLGYTCSINK